MAVDRVGNIFEFAGTTAPDGALECNAWALNKTGYPELYAAIGNTWDTTGGIAAPASHQFRLPPQANGSIGMFMRPKGASGENVGDRIANANKQHNHSITAVSTGSHSHSITMNYHNNVKSSGQTAVKNGSSVKYSNYAGTHSHTATTSSNTSGQHARPDCLVTLRCIWYK